MFEITNCDLKLSKGGGMSGKVTKEAGQNLRSQIVTSSSDNIQNCIYTVRGVQVMLDEDLAIMYGVETRTLNQTVKRNIERFPVEFMFQLSEDDVENLRSQFATSNTRGGRRYQPYAFTEQGVAMLSAVLRSESAVKMSVLIMQAFVSMRRFLLTNAQVFQRLDSLELKQMELDVQKFNEQHPPVEIQEIAVSHDRFLIIDDTTVYHIGASLKDLGKKWFAFSRMDMEAARMLDRLAKVKVAQ